MRRPDRSALRFGIVGIANTAFGLLVIYAAKGLAGLGDVPANLFGYTAGVLLSFALNSQWSFGYRGRLGPAFLRFLAVLLVAYLANLTVVLGAIDGFGLNTYLAQALGIIPYTVLFYLGSRLFAFRQPVDSASGAVSPRGGGPFSGR
jgi:putative flippase GtrA